MEMYALSEAKRRFSELVNRASRGERIGITRDGKLDAVIRPVEQEAGIEEVFARSGKVRKRSKKLKKVRR
jgi:prevent-host-death family protein